MMVEKFYIIDDLKDFLYKTYILRLIKFSYKKFTFDATSYI